MGLGDRLSFYVILACISTGAAIPGVACEMDTGSSVDDCFYTVSMECDDYLPPELWDIGCGFFNECVWIAFLERFECEHYESIMTPGGTYFGTFPFDTEELELEGNEYTAANQVYCILYTECVCPPEGLGYSCDPGETDYDPDQWTVSEWGIGGVCVQTQGG